MSLCLDMGVVRRHRCVGVAERLAPDLGIDRGIARQACRGVPALVQPYRSQARSLRERAESPTDEIRLRVSAAFATLTRLRHIRVSAQHADARHEAVEAFREIGLTFPPAEWQEAWTHVVVMARGALDVLREEAHAGLAQP
jgi:hypothetical protein